MCDICLFCFAPLLYLGRHGDSAFFVVPDSLCFQCCYMDWPSAHAGSTCCARQVNWPGGANNGRTPSHRWHLCSLKPRRLLSFTHLQARHQPPDNGDQSMPGLHWSLSSKRTYGTGIASLIPLRRLVHNNRDGAISEKKDGDQRGCYHFHFLLCVPGVRGWLCSDMIESLVSPGQVHLWWLPAATMILRILLTVWRRALTTVWWTFWKTYCTMLHLPFKLSLIAL